MFAKWLLLCCNFKRPLEIYEDFEHVQQNMDKLDCICLRCVIMVDGICDPFVLHIISYITLDQTVFASVSSKLIDYLVFTVVCH